MKSALADTSASARRARPLASALAFGWLGVLTIAPVAVWHQVIGDVLGSFHWSLNYAISELTPWVLLLAALAFFVPVAFSVGRDPESRLYPRARKAYFGWGTVLYLMGLALATQVGEVWSYAH